MASIKFENQICHSSRLRFLPASGPLRGTAGLGKISGVTVTDPPRGRPVGGGGTHRNRIYRSALLSCTDQKRFVCIQYCDGEKRILVTGENPARYLTPF